MTFNHSEFFEFNPEPMWVYDLERLAFLEVNRAAVARYGYSREEFLGMTIKDIRPDAEVGRLLKIIARGGPDSSDAGVWRHRLKNGNVVPVQIRTHTRAPRRIGLQATCWPC